MTKFLFIALFILPTYLWAFEVTTYNVGLAHTYVPHAKERTPIIIDALKNQNSDVLCLQEVWNETDRDLIINSLSKEYPFNFFTEASQLITKKAPACGPLELFGEKGFVRCMLKNCMDKKGDEFTSCSLNTCGGALNHLVSENRECAQALMSQVGKNIIMGILSLLNPFKGATLFAYDGSNGLLLLSKHPLTKVGKISFKDNSTLNLREALYARTSIEGVLKNFYCTHLTANLSGEVPYTGKQVSWEKENELQIKSLIEKIDRHDNEQVFVLGDFNCAFKDERLSGDFEVGCQQMIDADFSNHFKDTNPDCTFCGENSLINGKGKLLIDHIFTKNVQIKSSKRVFDNLVEIQVEGTTKSSNISDHYGVKILE